ncbi:cadherin-like beta sandwich domain-containing protein [Lysinibacillus sp. BNK-21]|uniref:cadherin-like beta sandwich domain-containing protein n=1 Tax=Lysinibacillus sp. BNK-21 TaxID=3376156 RepID=UPI003B4283D9
MQQPLKKGKLLLVTSVVIILCSLGFLPNAAKAAEITVNGEVISYIQYLEGDSAGILHIYSGDYLTKNFTDRDSLPTDAKWITFFPITLPLDNGIEYMFSRDGKSVEKQYVHNWTDIPSDVKWITVSNFDGDIGSGKNPITNQKYRYSVDGVNVVESATVPANALWANLSYYETISNGTHKRLRYEKVNYTLKLNPTPPVINLTKSPTGWTNGDVTVTANISSESDLKIQKWDYGIQNESYFNTAGNSLVGSSVSVDQNRTITWYARDILLNSTVQTITIDNIDKDAPIITSGNMTIITNQKLEVPITITDSKSGVKTKKWAFGNQNESYFLTGGNTFTENKIVVDNFGTYTLFAEDHAGNKSISTVHLYSADLEGLHLNEGTLSPQFSKEILSYDVNVMNTVSTITVIPNAIDSTATVKVNGNLVSSGATSATIPLNVGSNTILIEVTALNSTKKTYQVKVTRALSSNANLISLTLSSGILSPEISSGDSNYTASVENAITSLTITPTTADATAKIKVNGHAVNSGTASNSIPLNVGVNTVTIEVTAEDDTTQRTYTITITRFPSSNANLSDLTLSTGSYLPVFNGGDFTYTASVENAITSLTVTPTAADATAKIKVNGHAVSSGTASNPIPLNVGQNTVTIEVTAEDKTTQTYTVTVTRFPSSNSNLKSLTLNYGILKPSFDSQREKYSVNVDVNVNSIDLTPILDDNDATLMINGLPSSSGKKMTVSLNFGANTIILEITAPDGVTKKKYKVEIYREQLPAPVDSPQIPGNSAPVEPAAPAAPIELPQLVPTDPKQPQEPITDIIFPDVPVHHWAYTMIGDFAKRGYITGYADGTFKPNDPISRQHVALIFSRIFKLNPIQEAQTFKDIPLNHRYYETIKLVQQAGLYQGINGYFKPNENMTRAQIAKVLAIALNLSPTSTHTFKDIPSTHWAHDYIIALAANDIALGDSGYFKPESSVTRAQFVAFLYRALQQ